MRWLSGNARANMTEWERDVPNRSVLGASSHFGAKVRRIRGNAAHYLGFSDSHCEEQACASRSASDALLALSPKQQRPGCRLSPCGEIEVGADLHEAPSINNLLRARADFF